MNTLVARDLGAKDELIGDAIIYFAWAYRVGDSYFEQAVSQDQWVDSIAL